jgi:hypothetical protein
MLSRRQFCGILGGTVIGSTMTEAVFAGSKSVIEGKDALRSIPCDRFSAMKIHLEQWLVELRHKSVQVRRDELQKRFAEIGTCSEAVLFASTEGIPVAFQNELICIAKEAGLRVLSPVENPDVAWAVLEMIQADSNEFTTLALPLEDVGNQIRQIQQNQATCGYFYTRFFHRPGISIPLAFVLFETSRCFWDTYVSLEMLPMTSLQFRSVSWDCVDREYARLIDQTRRQFLE